MFPYSFACSLSKGKPFGGHKGVLVYWVVKQSISADDNQFLLRFLLTEGNEIINHRKHRGNQFI